MVAVKVARRGRALADGWNVALLSAHAVTPRGREDGGVTVRSRRFGPERSPGWWAWLLLVLPSLALVLGVGVASASHSSGEAQAAVQPVVADFNGDGRPDIAFLANPIGSPSYQVRVRLGDGQGGFRDAPASPSVPQAANAIVVGNFNADRNRDVLVLSTSGKAALLLGNGKGGFHRAPRLAFTSAGWDALAAGDFNGDGHLDAVVASGAPQYQLRLETFFGDGHGRFSAGPSTVVPAPGGGGSFGEPDPLAAGDFNGDGHLDLAYAYGPDISCMACSLGPYPNGALDVMLGDGHGGFHEASGSPYPGGVNMQAGAGGYNPVVADFNGDGYSDLAQADYDWRDGSSTVRVLLGGPSGQLHTAPGSPFATPIPGSLATGDVNGDGHLDLVSADPALSANAVAGYAVLLGDGAGGFRDAPGSPWHLQLLQDTADALGDFNRDGRADLVVAEGGEGGPYTSGLRILLSGPIVALTAPARVRVRAPVRLAAAAVKRREFMPAAITDYRWDLGSGHFTIDSHTTPSTRVTFHRTGLHEIRLQVTDSAGRTSIGAKRLHVVPRLIPRHRG